MPKGTRWIRPVKVVIVVGAPLSGPPVGEGSVRIPRRAVSELTARLHSDLQGLFDQALRAAGRA
jgi:hypothetical protein